MWFQWLKKVKTLSGVHSSCVEGRSWSVVWMSVFLVLCICRLEVQCQPLDIVYHPTAMQCISQFFSPQTTEADRADLEPTLLETGGPGELSAAARRRYEQWKDNTKAGLQNTLDGLISIPETVRQISFHSQAVSHTVLWILSPQVHSILLLLLKWCGEGTRDLLGCDSEFYTQCAIIREWKKHNYV